VRVELTRREWVRRAKHLRRTVYEAAGSQRMSRPALYDLDSKLAPYLPERPGTFVEVGANDGYTQSNTYYLERWLGWSGVLVEPFPHLYERCRRTRRNSRCFNCVLVEPERAGQPVEMAYADLMSLVRGARGDAAADERHVAEGERSNRVRSFTVTVQGRTMADVLDEAQVGPVDLMVVDTEGYEAQVLRGADLARHKPQLVLVEMKDEAVAEVLAPWYDRVAALTYHDVLFARR
jgi:FkbM family methyltransferase